MNPSIFFKLVVKYVNHKINHFKHFKCTVLIKYILTVVQTLPPSVSRSLLSQTDTLYPLNSHYTLPNILATIIQQLSVTMNLTTLGACYEWNYTLFVLL